MCIRDRGKFSEVRGVKIDSKASALYFLHAAAGDAEGEIARYAVNYSDGTKAEIPIVMNRNVGAWDAVLNPDKNAETVAGFINPDNRGLYVWKCENPFPHKLIKSVDAVLTRPSAAYFAAIAGVVISFTGRINAPNKKHICLTYILSLSILPP